ncbi:MAG: SprB repeat-containing protein, partial [Bacteroidota bacterium]|nr:SprB repeat-containing protein [Bacteroidota bacterium]
MKKILLTSAFLLTGLLAFSAGHVATAVFSNPTCFGSCNASATGMASSGIGPYGYTWTGSGGYTGMGANITGLCAGSYTLTAIDSSDLSTATYTFNISNPPPFVAATNPGTTICAGQSTTLFVNTTGGTPGYTYFWTPTSSLSSPTVVNPIASPVTTTNYTVTVTDANGCIANASTTITVSPTPVITLNPTASSCGACNGAITVSAGGGYTYSWGGPSGYSSTTMNPTGLCAGNYTVTATNTFGCTTITGTTIGSSTPLILSTSPTSPSCGACDGSIAVSLSGGTAPYTFDWSPGTPIGDGSAIISSLCVGTYTVMVVDANGCAALTSLFLNSASGISAVNTSVTDANCSASDGAVMITSVTGGVG